MRKGVFDKALLIKELREIPAKNPLPKVVTGAPQSGHPPLPKVGATAPQSGHWRPSKWALRSPKWALPLPKGSSCFVEDKMRYSARINGRKLWQSEPAAPQSGHYTSDSERPPKRSTRWFER